MASQEIEALSSALARLPGLGPRSARRAVLWLVKHREQALPALLEALAAVSDTLVECQSCGNVDTRNPCGICTDPRRDARALCVVEEVADLWALDRSRLFPGRYHVLGGRLSALDGIGPEDLTIASLLARVEGGGVDEVVLAMNATLEGQTTAHYIAERLEAFPLRVTQLAHGLPVGGELDYLDEGTLAQALRARRPVGSGFKPSTTMIRDAALSVRRCSMTLYSGPSRQACAVANEGNSTITSLPCKGGPSRTAELPALTM